MDLKQFCIDNNIPPEKLGDIGEVSDGFHTFNSLYYQRLVLFATLVNAFPTLSWKSHKHHNGELPFGGGWFIVGIDTPAGSYTYHYKDTEWGIFRCPEVETAPEWDGHTDKDVHRLLSLTDKPEDWADREIAMACACEKESNNIACYNRALRSYRALMQDNPSSFDGQISKSILNRLIDGNPLTPIEDTPDIWSDVTGEFKDWKDGVQHYRCKRLDSLFKEVGPDGTVTYTDVKRVQVVNLNIPDLAYTNGFTTRLIDKLFPISLPYLPTTNKYKVVREAFSTDPDGDGYDTLAYLYVITPSGEKVELNGYFKKDKDAMVHIEKAEYEERKIRKVEIGENK